MYIVPAALDENETPYITNPATGKEMDAHTWRNTLEEVGWIVGEVRPVRQVVFANGKEDLHLPYLIGIHHRRDSKPSAWLLCSTDPTGVFADHDPPF